MHRFASPARFVRISEKLLPILAAGALMLLSYGSYRALLASPVDYQQGEMVRLMYIHVPFAWLATMGYGFMAASSFVFLVWRHSLADIAARAAAPIGAVFAFLTLVTGSIWGKPTWGAYWVWDARLTSVLILFFMYVGYLMLSAELQESERKGKILGVLSLIGAINLPIIKFSVEWWNTLHQPASLLRAGGPSIDPSLLTPLLIMMGGFFCLYGALLLVRMRTLLAEKKIRRLQLT